MSINLSTKLLALVVFLASALCGFAGYAIYSISMIGKQVEHITLVETPIAQLVSTAVEHRLEQEIVILGTLAQAALGRDQVIEDRGAAYGELARKIDGELAKIDALVAGAVAEGGPRAAEYRQMQDLLRRIRKSQDEVAAVGPVVFSQLNALVKASSGRTPNLAYLGDKIETITKRNVSTIVRQPG